MLRAEPFYASRRICQANSSSRGLPESVDKQKADQGICCRKVTTQRLRKILILVQSLVRPNSVSRCDESQWISYKPGYGNLRVISVAYLGWMTMQW